MPEIAAPRVSVLMPAFNRERFIGEAIASITAQHDRACHPERSEGPGGPGGAPSCHPVQPGSLAHGRDDRGVDFELIVIDDASTDRTAEIAEEWAARDPRVRVLRLPVNSGASFALNAGIDVARGTYIARLDSDDVAMPERLARQAALLDEKPEVSLVGTNYLVIDEEGQTKAIVDRVEEPDVLAYMTNFENALGIGGSGMCRAAAVRALGGFSRELRLAQGYELWARLARIGRVEILPYAGVKYRVHGGSVSVTAQREQKRAAVEVSRRTMSASTGRAVTTAEAEAVMARWWMSPKRGVSETAHAVMWEVFERFRHSPAAPRMRVMTAGRFARSALALARRGAFGEALRCVRLAAKWHPGGHSGLLSSALSMRRMERP